MALETTGEINILVCISASPSNQRVIRSAAKFARGRSQRLTALYVDSKKGRTVSSGITANLALASQLGAQTEIISSTDITGAIIGYARAHKVTDLFIGYSGPSRGSYPHHLPVYQLSRQLPQVDVHIIPDARARLRPSELQLISDNKPVMKDVLTLLAVMSAATGISFLFYRSTFSNSNIITVYILAVLITAALTAQRVYGILAAILYILLFNFLFIEPRYSFLVYDPNYLVTYLVSIIAAVITGNISSRLKQSSMQARLNAYQAQVLLNTSELLQQAGSSTQIARITAMQLGELLGRDIVFYPVKDHTLIREECISSSDTAPPRENAASRQAAAWTLQHNQRAGWGTRHFPEAGCQYLSVRTANDIYGVISVSSEEGPLNNFEENILLSLIGECALSLEAQKNREEGEAALIIAENERFRSKLLRSVSHDLRTPLTSISGNAANLMEHADDFTSEELYSIYSDIHEDSIWLIDLVENLLSITRLEGNVELHLTGEVVADVLSTAVERARRYKNGHSIRLENDDECLVARMDVSLILQVLGNLIGNAVKHTPAGTQIVVSDRRDGDKVLISVADNGQGISDEDLPYIFDLFYSGKKSSGADSGRSLGLGLNLCRSIAEAHGQSLEVKKNEPSGTVFYFTLELWEEKSSEIISYSDSRR